ncbi:MAG TPA: cytochrome c [Vicinamibacterales bacterium]|nr:cytochrome c [Vicinamibacterales bacterium]
MNRSIAVLCAVGLLSAWVVAFQSERTVWEGVYTEEQARRGQAVFGVSCARCHAPEDFSSETFLTSWENSTALDLLRLVQRTMPMDEPGSLRPENYADVVAYFFSLNAFPAGKTELDTDAQRLGLIRIKAKNE